MILLLHSSHHPTHEDGTPWLQDTEAAVVAEPRAGSDGGEPGAAHRPAVRERGAVEPRPSPLPPHWTRSVKIRPLGPHLVIMVTTQAAFSFFGCVM